MPFTDRQIAGLKPKASRYEKTEPGRSGLRIRVTPRGVKTWGYLYRFDGKQKRLVFGTYPVMGVAKAHSALSDAREKLLAGIDPGAVQAEARAVERNAETMAELVAEYLQRHARPNMKPISAAEDERLLNREIIPHLGTTKAKGVTRRDLIIALDRIADRGAPVVRNRVAGVLSRLFNFAMDRGIVDASPAAGIRRLAESARERVLTPQEIQSLWLGLDEIAVTPPVRLAIKFALATGQRRAEVCEIVWPEIDKAEALWRLPGERAKNGRENIIPLPPFAMALIEEAEKFRVKSSPFMFPGRFPDRPFNPKTASYLFRQHHAALGIGNATMHDLRRSFATHHSEIGTPPDVLSMLLNHAPTSITQRIYDRSKLIEPKRQAMGRWCDWLQLVIAGEFDIAKEMQGADIVPLTEVA